MIKVKRKPGRPRKNPVVEPPIIETPLEPKPQESPEKEFLMGFLSGGPILRTYVYRESQNHGLDWEKVKQEFITLKGWEYMVKKDILWRIMPE